MAQKNGTSEKNGITEKPEDGRRPPTDDCRRTESRRSELDEPMAPDGGWGWVILFASFVSSVIVDGVCFSFGIFLLEFLDYFGASKSRTAWIGSTLNGTYMIMGPIVSALANRFGCRAVAIAGSLWAAVAFFLSTFSPNVAVLTFTYGVLGGMGFGLMYLPSIVIVGYYFDKRRALATGIATCGSGVGAFIFAPMCRALIDAYGWRGAMWIVSAIVLNGLVLGGLYRPLTFDDLELIREKWRAQKAADDLIIAERKRKISENIDQLVTIETPVTNNPAKPVLGVAFQEAEPLIIEGSDKVQGDLQNLRKNILDRQHRRRIRSTSESNDVSTSNVVLNGPVSHDVKCMTDSWHSLSQYVSSMESLTFSLPSVTPSGYFGGQPPAASTTSLVKDILENIRDNFDFTVMQNPVFVIYGFSCILCMAGFFVPFIYLPDKSKNMGFSPSKGALLLSILGITNTVGRILAGWISDRPWADCLMINNISLIVGGLATMFCPFCNSYTQLVIYSCVFGLCIASFVSLRSIILVDLIGLHKLTSAFGIIVLCQGITSFVGAPIAGFLYDVTGSYDVSFYYAGTTITLAGVINLPLRRLVLWQEKRKRKKNKSKEDNVSVKVPTKTYPAIRRPSVSSV